MNYYNSDYSLTTPPVSFHLLSMQSVLQTWVSNYKFEIANLQVEYLSKNIIEIYPDMISTSI